MADPAYIVDGVLSVTESWVAVAPTTTVPLTGATSLIVFESTDDGQVGDFSQYMGLVVVIYARSAVSAASGGCYLNINNDTTGHYHRQYLWGNGSNVYAGSATTQSYVPFGDIPANSAGANIFGCGIAHLYDINSGKYKSVTTHSAGDRNGSGWAQMDAAILPSQAPITELDISASADIVIGSQFSLFGILPRMVA